MTLDQIQTLRRDEPRKFDALVAEKVMGWEWLERVHGESDGVSRKALFPPERGGWERLNYLPAIWRPAKPETEPFSDWDRVGAVRDPKSDRWTQHGVPRYGADPAADYAVLERRISGLNLWRHWKTFGIVAAV